MTDHDEILRLARALGDVSIHYDADGRIDHVIAPAGYKWSPLGFAEYARARLAGSGERFTPYLDHIMKRRPEVIRGELNRLQSKVVDAQQALRDGRPDKAAEILRR